MINPTSGSVKAVIIKIMLMYFPEIVYLADKLISASLSLIKLIYSSFIYQTSVIKLVSSMLKQRTVE